MYLCIDELGERASLNHVIDQDAQRTPTTVFGFNARVVSQRRFENDARSRSNYVLVGALAKILLRSPFFPGSRVALLRGQNRGTEPGGFDIPALLSAEHMHRITRGKRC